MEKMPEAMGFIKNNNYSLIEIDKEHIVCEAKITETSLNAYGICHGGFIFGLCDTAAGVLAYSLNKRCFTTSSTINYLKPCVGEKIICRSNVIRNGKTLGVFESKIFNEKDELCAISTVNFIYN